MSSEPAEGVRDERGITGTVANHIVVDWPRSIGFFGAIGAAVALDLVSVPIAMFVAAVPFLKLMNRPQAAQPQRFVSHLVDGAAKPVGGDSEGTIRWATPEDVRRARQAARRSAARRTSRPSRRRTRTRTRAA